MAAVPAPPATTAVVAPSDNSGIAHQLAARIEILVFTFNRAAQLERLLKSFADSPFRLCRFTVVDNASTDDTPLVCRQAQDALTTLHHVQNRINIGGAANYLRALELAAAPYAWIICDDDTYDFTEANDLINSLISERYDLISVGTEGHNLPPGWEGRSHDFALQFDYFVWHGFIPCLIFRSSLVSSNILRSGHEQCDTLLPHFPLLAALVTRTDCTLRVTHGIVIHKGTSFGYAPLRLVGGWMKACAAIPDPIVRRAARSQVLGGMRFLKNVFFGCMLAARFQPWRVFEEYREMLGAALHYHRWTFFRLLPFAPFILAPHFIHQWIGKRYDQFRQKRRKSVLAFDADR